ncbi:hypothetical protein [Streptacidiphilus monticola]|uniref:Uncharacterized protein n=1 Tax=Streptacidiphilus monticola TaxID=2161674 RepID=A0ABW1FY07_9ACTN
MEVPRPPRPARLRVRLGWLAGAAGAALLVLGWYGISGERYAERQLPYLASATVPGAALVIAAAVLLAGGSGPDRHAEQQEARLAELQRQLDLLTQLLAEQRAASPAASGPPSGGADDAPPADGEPGFYLVPGGRTFHRAGCLLLHGRQDVRPLEAAEGLRPCPLCDPREH